MIEIKDFKGNPIISLKKDEDDEYPFSFGLKKARLIVENYDDIVKFVEENSIDEEG